MTTRSATVIPIALAGLLLTGCTPGVWRGDVVVALDPALRDQAGRWPTLEVDLLAVPQADAATWQTVPVAAYFEPDNQGRAAAPRVTIWFDGQHPVGVLKRDDPIWESWQGQKADTLVAFANLLAVERAPVAVPATGTPAPADQRRLVLSLLEDRVPLDRSGRLVIKANALGLAPVTAASAATAKLGQDPAQPGQIRTAGDDHAGSGAAPQAKPSPVRRAEHDDTDTLR